jgi:hypothetical protein
MLPLKGLRLALLACGLFAADASAGIISFGEFDNNLSVQAENFERVGTPINGELATNQFANSGLNFRYISGFPVSLFNNAYCSPSSGSVSGNSYVGIGVSTTCRTSRSVSSASVLFDYQITAFSFDYSVVADSAFRFELFDDGNLVRDVALTLLTNRQAEYEVFSNISFDEVRFIEGTGYESLWIDNFRWQGVSVSAPAMGGLFLLSSGIFLLKRKRS